MKNTFTDREKHALYQGLMMPISILFHKRTPLYDDLYSDEAHYVQLGETIAVTGIVTAIALLIWRKRK